MSNPDEIVYVAMTRAQRAAMGYPADTDTAITKVEAVSRMMALELKGTRGCFACGDCLHNLFAAAFPEEVRRVG